jgi:hypothetical protein
MHLSLRAHLTSLKYVLHHKWLVFQECVQYGLYWQGLIHDFSKFYPAEWGAYTLYFNGGYENVKPPAVQAAFDAARNHHHNHNPHHWQYHLLVHNDGSMMALPIPDRYRREMMAEWHATSRMMGASDCAGWYLKHRNEVILHPDTRVWVEQELATRLRHDPIRLQTFYSTLQATTCRLDS